MTTVNTATDSSVVSNNTTSNTSETWQPPATSKERVQAHKEAVAAQENKDTVSISERAQKIKKLNEEFFPHGPKSVTITQGFIARLQEYGFLTDQQALQLSPPSEKTSGSSSTLSEISSFTSRFSSELKEIDPENSLITTLEQAKEVIDNFNSISTRDVPEDIQSLVNNINEYLKTEASTNLNAEDRSDLEQLSAALRVADKLGGDSNTKNNDLTTYEQLKP